VTRYLRVWGEFLRLTFRRFPVLTTVLLASLTVDMAVPAAIALALRSVVNASASHQARAAVYAAAGVGLVSCLDYLLGHVTSWLRILLVERFGFTDLEREITESVYGIEGIGHLERTDYLDRVTVLRYSTRLSAALLADAWAFKPSGSAGKNGLEFQVAWRVPLRGLPHCEAY